MMISPNCCTRFLSSKNFTELLSNPIFASIVSIIGVAVVHYIFINLYYLICVPSGFTAIIWNIVSLGSPFCYAINTIQYKLAENYVIIWTGAVMAVVGWFASKVKLKY